MTMRKLWLTLLTGALLVLPAVATAGRGAPGDGSLVVTDASGRMTVSGHGLIFGHLDRGSIVVVGEYKPDDNTSLPSVSGARLRLSGANVVYTGSDVRFLFPAGRYTLILDGTGIDISAVGSGRITAPYAFSGNVALDGGHVQPLDSVVGTLVYGKGNSAAAAAAANGKGRNT